VLSKRNWLLALSIGLFAVILGGFVVLRLAALASSNLDSLLTTGTRPGDNGRWTRMLLDRSGTAERLEAELKRAVDVPDRERLLERVDKKRKKIERLGAERRDAELLELLSVEGSDERRFLTELLAMIQGPGYIDSFTDRRVEASRTLTFFPTDEGLEALISVLADERESTYLRRAVAEDLRQFDDYRARRALEEYPLDSTAGAAATPTRSGSREESSPQQKSSVSARSRELQSASREVRRNAIQALASQPGNDPVAGLLTAIEDPHPENRALAIRALEGRRHHDIDAALVQVIEHERVRAPLLAALDVLPQCQAHHTTAMLLAYGHTQEQNRTLLISALGECNDERVVPILLDAMESPDAELALAGKNAVLTLGARKHRKTLGPLIDVMTGPRSLSVKKTVSQVLRRMTGQSFGNDGDRWQDWWQERWFEYEA
jgi:HEAT repeat protein